MTALEAMFVVALALVAVLPVSRHLSVVAMPPRLPPVHLHYLGSAVCYNTPFFLPSQFLISSK